MTPQPKTTRTYLSNPVAGGPADLRAFVAHDTPGPARVYVGEVAPGFFPAPAGLDIEGARQVRDALERWIRDQAVEREAPEIPAATVAAVLTGANVDGAVVAVTGFINEVVMKLAEPGKPCARVKLTDDRAVIWVTVHPGIYADFQALVDTKGGGCAVTVIGRVDRRQPQPDLTAIELEGSTTSGGEW